MRLSKTNIDHIPASANLLLPGKFSFDLPEKVLQFGTGVLLRGLPDIMFHRSNMNGSFNGRIVMVKSTAQGDTDSFQEQDCLYTVCLRGIDAGKKIEENHVVSSISRVLSASAEWDSILECAANPEMQVIISNTTEVGITLVPDKVHATPPASFPGKLLSFLYQRFKVFHGDPGRGMIIIPTELIPSNGDKLLAIVLELAHQNGLETSFLDWLETSNHFCNSLVDRIVPGKLDKPREEELQQKLGYTDELMIMSETYQLWAVQSSSDKVRKILALNTPGFVLAPDINKFRELKLRLLNGSHTFTCGLAVLAGFNTVKEAMDASVFSGFIEGLMHDAICPAISDPAISAEEASAFVEKVLDRYRNPFIDHKWISITSQFSSKMYLRNAQTIRNYIESFGHSAAHMSLGMAAFIRFMKTEKNEKGEFWGGFHGHNYKVTDENAALFSSYWRQGSSQQMVRDILSNADLWESDLADLDGFADDVHYWLNILEESGATSAMAMVQAQKKECIK